MVFDVVQQRIGGPFQEYPGPGRGVEGLGDGVQQAVEFGVHHLGVQPLLRAEMLVDHGFGYPGCRCNLLDGRAVEPAQGKEAAGHFNELGAALDAGHTQACDAGGSLYHRFSLPMHRRPSVVQLAHATAPVAD